MSLIQVKFDNTLTQSDIIVALTHSSKEEAGAAYKVNQQEMQQTSIYGIHAPLISVNNIVVDFTDVISFSLNGDGVLPTVNMMIIDRQNLISMVDTPSVDNELRVQILPKFEDKYKKVNLTFYITSMRINRGLINISGIYKMPKFVSSNIKSFGEINTYKLFETIATETGLGFASNMGENDEDKRWVYCNNKSYKDLLDNEIRYSGYDLQICDYWIDWWNNLVVADIYERYNATDKDEDMQLWVATQNHEAMEGIEVEPHQVPAVLNNNPSYQTSELFVKNYSIVNSPGSIVSRGSDHLYSIYETAKSEYVDHLIQDGDVKKDIVVKYEYLGEVYGEHNYLLASKKRDTFLQKIRSNDNIKVTLNTPLLGLMRGNRVNFLWYINNDSVKNKHNSLLENEYIEKPVSGIPGTDDSEEPKAQDGSFELDNSISGQYLITSCKLNFASNQWEYVITLSRPTSARPKLIPETE